VTRCLHFEAATLVLVLGLTACDSPAGTGATTTTGAKLAESGTKRGSAGGFSAMLAQELGPPEGSLGAAAPGATPTAPAASGGAPGAKSAGAPAATATVPAGGATAPAATATVPAGGATAPGAKSPAAPAGGAPAGGATAPAGGATAPAAGATVATASNVGQVSSSGAATRPATPTQPATPAATKPPAPAPAPVAAAAPGGAIKQDGLAQDVPAGPNGKTRTYVRPPGEVAAIKFDLEPNWERDFGEAGTFSLVVKVPESEETRVFSVQYGYDDPNAPVDCDQYRKFLEENKIMTVTVNRQRGGACYVESATTFRYLVNYGGKRLMCRGSLYKDSGLGDLRDKVLMQAKKICETLAL
jgi:hypothetical protein